MISVRSNWAKCYNFFVNDNKVIYKQSEPKVTYQQLLEILSQMDQFELSQKVLIENYEANIATDYNELDFYQMDLGCHGDDGDGQWVFLKK
jgi:hypothetical protein